MWPTGLPNIGKLQRNSQSTPGTISDGWQMFECCLRRYGIASFESAVSQMREIAKADGTKTDSECVRPTKIHYKTRTQESPVVDETKSQGKPVRQFCTNHFYIQDKCQCLFNKAGGCCTPATTQPHSNHAVSVCEFRKYFIYA